MSKGNLIGAMMKKQQLNAFLVVHSFVDTVMTGCFHRKGFIRGKYGLGDTSSILEIGKLSVVDRLFSPVLKNISSKITL